MLRTFLVLLALFVIAIIVFSVPAVQTSIARKITKTLKEDYDVDINIGRVGLSYSGDVDLREIFIKDHHNDTLIYAGGIQTSILSVTELINGSPMLGDVTIENLTFRMKIYKDESSDNLMTFVRKFNSNTNPPSQEKFVLTTDEVEILNGKFSFENENLQTPKSVDFYNINLQAENLGVDGEDFYINTEELSFNTAWGLTVSNLKTDFKLTPTQMDFKNLNLVTPYSDIIGQIVFTYEPGGMEDFENQVNIVADFEDAIISTTDLENFYSEFGKGYELEIDNTQIKGTLNDFTVVDSDIRGMDRSLIQGDFRIRNVVGNPQNFKLDGEFKNLTTNYYDLVNLLPNVLGNSLPKELYKLGNVKAVGNAIVTTNDVDLDLDLYSQLGKVNVFVLLGELDDVTKSTYNGNIISNNFNLGRLLEKETIGSTAFDIHVDGNGFTLESLNSKVEGDIRKLEFNNYTYKNLKVLGNIRENIFDGNLMADDPNVKFTFNGVADLSEEVHNYDFIANIDLIDLKKLNFFTRDSISMLNGDVIMDMKGTGLDDAYGTISFEKALYKNENARYYFDDFKIESSFDENNVRTITVNSPDIVEGSVTGKFRFKNVYDLFRNSIGSLYTNFEPTKVTDNEFMEFNFKVYNKIVEVFYPEIEFGPNTIIKGRVESDDSEFKLTFKSPELKLFGNYLGNIDVQVDNKNPLFNTYIAVDTIGTGTYNVSEFSLINVTLKDTLFMRSEFKGGLNNRDNYNLQFYHTINEDNNSVFGFRKSDFTFKGYQWDINENKSKITNKIIFENDFKDFDIKSLVLTHDNEEININGEVRGKDYKNIKGVFENVDLNKITPSIDSLRLAGRVNGELAFLQEKGVYFPTSTITIDSLGVNDTRLGKLSINASGNESLTEFKINTKLVGPDNNQSFSAIGSINVAGGSESINLDVDFKDFNMSGFSALGGDVISNIRGIVSGSAKVLGKYANPSIDGRLLLKNAGLKIPYLNVDLNLEDNAVVKLSGQRFNFEDVNITDTAYNTKGILGGYIEHYQFSKWNMGLRLLAPDRLLVLNTEGDEDSLYYGTAFISGQAEINGPTDELVIDVIARTERGTIFKIPLNDTESLGDNSYIHFLSPEEKRARLRGQDIQLEEVNGLALNFDLDVNNNAEVEIVVDQTSGSSLRGRGAGTLLIEINTNGKFNMWGDFVVYEGTYNFKYAGLVEKIFRVKDGGTIVWDGSPTRAVLDLSAIYRTQANPAVLLENSTVNRDIPVEVLIHLNGDLIQPDLDFSIDFPNVSSVVKSELEYRLDDQSAREIQALSLVTQGQFYNSANLGQNVITGNLVERASSLVSGIFSDPDDKVKIGLDYVQGDRFQDQERSDQFGVTVSTQINKRVLINGKVGVPIGGVNQSPIVGNVEIEYLFNEDGSLRGKVFNRENDIQFIGGESQGYTQGIGLSYSVDFDNFNELWNKIFKAKKETDSISKVQDTLRPETPDFINFTEDDTKQ